MHLGSLLNNELNRRDTFRLVLASTLIGQEEEFHFVEEKFEMQVETIGLRPTTSFQPLNIVKHGTQHAVGVYQ
jgi:hypothetical protein